MSNPWFESVAVAQRRAKRRLPKSVYSALIAGSEAGVTLADNVAAFTELGFAPHVVGAPTQRDMSTTVMGQDIKDTRTLGIGVSAGIRREDVKLREAFNKAIGSMLSDGTYKQLNDKYFPFPLN